MVTIALWCIGAVLAFYAAIIALYVVVQIVFWLIAGPIMGLVLIWLRLFPSR